MKAFKGTQLHSVPNKIIEHRQSRINSVESVTIGRVPIEVMQCQGKGHRDEEDLLKCGMTVRCRNKLIACNIKWRRRRTNRMNGQDVYLIFIN
jgi:hypothetical protein